MRPGRVPVAGLGVDAVGFAEAVDRVVAWARRRESRYVCAANAHMVVTAHEDPSFRAVMEGADLVVPDGMPLVWLLRRAGVRGQERVAGPDLMLALCGRAAAEGLPVGLYGGTPETLAKLAARLASRFPGLRIAYRHAPPFHPLGPGEDARVVEAIGRSGARILFVGLGCPKQERWMAEHRGRVRAVMLGVGAAFDFHAGARRRAPPWMQRAGLEWLWRLGSEPRRLWRRYLVGNARFLWYATRARRMRRAG